MNENENDEKYKVASVGISKRKVSFWDAGQDGTHSLSQTLFQMLPLKLQKDEAALQDLSQ